MKMKVLFVHEGYISKQNNNYYSLHYNNTYINRYKTIAKNVLFLVREESFNQNELNQNKLDVEDFEFIGVKNYKNIKNIKYLFEVQRRIENAVVQSDYIIARLPGSLGNIAIKYAIKHKKRYMVELVGCAWDALWNHSLLGKFYAPWLFMKTKNIVRRAPYVVYVTKEFLQNRYPTRGYATNISDVSIPKLAEFRTDKGINKTKHIKVGTIGSVNLKYKGHKYVIQALSNLKDLNYDIEYQIVGGGDNNYLQQFANTYNLTNEVKFIGSLPHQQVFSWLKDIDIYIQPSNTEGLPRALIEAMSESCICIGSNAGGIPELLPQSNIFQRRNVEDLIRVLRQSIDSGEDTKRYTFEKSANYSKEAIDHKRKAFYEKFRDNTY